MQSQGAATSSDAAVTCKVEAHALQPPSRPAATPNWERPSASINWQRRLGQGSFGAAYEVTACAWLPRKSPFWCRRKGKRLLHSLVL
eukprot:2567626-Prymnesium_polylepis.3